MKVDIRDDNFFVELHEVRLGGTFLLNGEVFIRTFNNMGWQDGLPKVVNLATGACVSLTANQPVKPIHCKVVEDAE